MRGTDLFTDLPAETEEEGKKEETAMIYPRGEIYWLSFQYKGKHYQESTGERSKKRAAEFAEARKTEIRAEWKARSEKAQLLGCEIDELQRCAECNALFKAATPHVAGSAATFCSDECRERQRKREHPAPLLCEFLEREFLPFSAEKNKDKPNTVKYYRNGAKHLMDSALALMALDKITDQDATVFAAQHSAASPATVNCGLRTLRRCLRLACNWSRIDRRPEIALQKGERRRERVLTAGEINTYLNACTEPWCSIAVILLGTGMRPGEVAALRWENIQLNNHSGLLQITDGKSKAARRMLPLVPAVHDVLRARFEATGQPEEGWVFPAERTSGHVTSSTMSYWHKCAKEAIHAQGKPFKPFCPYTMRHTALTRLGEKGCDAFTLARIAGHSSIVITQRYVHPQADAIEQAFAKLDTLETKLAATPIKSVEKLSA
jgi:integrase